ncbi:condensation domain-containing protein, partial [Tahibacter aquaticus]|uniref:condensation domain-containing protein n=1 Tax=Tahibacter aquaticus TaxID=520092 RepID=UPI001FB59D00
AQARAGYAPIATIGRDGPLALSFAQQRLWFIDRLEGGSAQYNLPIALRLQGKLDQAALQQALDALVARHEVLRTVYAEVDGVALQRIQAAAPVAIAREDLRQLDAGLREQQLQQRARDEALRPFDLASDPMLRCRLLQLGESDNALLFTMHHIASDGWSLGVLVQEFVALYAGLVSGQAAQLPALPVQYADYAAWQRERLQGARLQQHLDYWRTQLAGLPVLHGLPLDLPRPAQQCFDGGRIDVELDAPTLAAVTALARRQGASLFMLLQAAFAVLLSRWSGETDIVIGTPIAGRLHPDVEPLIGFFINTLVLRTDLSGAPSFDAVLAQAKAAALAAYEHQEIPFEMLVDELKPVRSLSHTPLVQVMLTLQNNAQSALELPGLSLVPMTARYEQLKFDLQLVVAESAQGLRLSWIYAQSLFRAETIARMAQGFSQLLAQVAQQPQRRLDELEWLDAAASRALIAAGAGSVGTLQRHELLPLQFAAQAQRTPEAIALVSGSQQLSYRELDEKSDRLAR